MAITDRAHEFGADLGMVLGDLLDLVHTLTRLRSVPELRDGLALPEMERTRGAALADKLSIPVLGRAWQMLLKGIAEVDQAPDRRAALRREAADLDDARTAEAGRETQEAIAALRDRLAGSAVTR